MEHAQKHAAVHTDSQRCPLPGFCNLHLLALTFLLFHPTQERDSTAMLSVQDCLLLQHKLPGNGCLPRCVGTEWGSRTHSCDHNSHVDTHTKLELQRESDTACPLFPASMSQQATQISQDVWESLRNVPFPQKTWEPSESFWDGDTGHTLKAWHWLTAACSSYNTHAEFTPFPSQILCRVLIL